MSTTPAEGRRTDLFTAAVTALVAAAVACAVALDLALGAGAVGALGHPAAEVERGALTLRAVLFLTAGAVPWAAGLGGGLAAWPGPGGRPGRVLRATARWWLLGGAVALLATPMGAL